MSDRHSKWTPVEPGTVIPAGTDRRRAMNAIVECQDCGDTVPGITRTEAAQDAARLGWERVSGRLLCGPCVDEARQP